MLPLQQPWERKAAYDKGDAKGLAASDPARTIKINVIVFGLPEFPDMKQRPTFNAPQNTPVRDILRDVHLRLPRLEREQRPVTIMTTAGRVLGLEIGDVEVMELLQPWHAAVLDLRVDVPAPKKGSVGSRIRKALGCKGGGAAKAVQIAPSASSVRSAPPPYEEATRSVISHGPTGLAKDSSKRRFNEEPRSG